MARLGQGCGAACSLHVRCIKVDASTHRDAPHVRRTAPRLSLQDFGLHRYASAFASDGLAAVVTDYRGYGGSDGTPRQWVSARRNRADLRDALAAVRGQLFGAVDASRLVLWGTSFSAGQCLLLAAAPDVAPLLSAVVAQVRVGGGQSGFRHNHACTTMRASLARLLTVGPRCLAQMPHLDPGHAVSSSLASRGHWKSLRMLAAGLLDVTRGALGLAPVYLPLVGPPGSLAFLQMSEQQLQQYWSNHPAIPQVRAACASGHAWTHARMCVGKQTLRLTARVRLPAACAVAMQGGWLNVGRAAYTIEHTFLRTRPISAVGSIIVPVLYVGAAHDDVCPLSLIEAAAAATPHAEIEMVPADHFNFFQAHHLGPLLKKQAAFIWRHVGMEAGSGADDAVAAAAETQLQHAEL